jgi:hypothetical protein
VLCYPNLVLTCQRCNLLLQTRLWGPSHGGMTVSSTQDEMFGYNQAVWRRKASNPTTRFTCRETINLLWEKFEYLQVSNITAGKT